MGLLACVGRCNSLSTIMSSVDNASAAIMVVAYKCKSKPELPLEMVPSPARMRTRSVQIVVNARYCSTSHIYSRSDLQRMLVVAPAPSTIDKEFAQRVPRWKAKARTAWGRSALGFEQLGDASETLCSCLHHKAFSIGPYMPRGNLEYCSARCSYRPFLRYSLGMTTIVA